MTRPTARTNLLRRLSVPLLSASLLVGAGAAFVFPPLHAGGEACGGNAVSIGLGDRPASPECRSRAITDLVFGASVVAAGVGVGAVGIVVLRSGD